jgi:DNA-binding FadR family transcriptional regulator
MGDPELWRQSYQEHRQILKAISSSDPDFAEQETVRIIRRFSGETIDLLAKLRRTVTPASNKRRLVQVG